MKREMIGERTKAALAVAREGLGRRQGYRPPSTGPDTRAAARVRREGTERSGHRLVLELGAACANEYGLRHGIVLAMMDRGMPTLNGSIREFCAGK
jgi:hypothetical protein